MTPISHFDLLAHYWANFSPVFSSKMLRTGLIFLPSPDPRWSFQGPVCGPPCGAVCCDYYSLTIRWSPPGPVLSSGSKIIRKMLRISVVTFGPVLVHAPPPFM